MKYFSTLLMIGFLTLSMTGQEKSDNYSAQHEGWLVDLDKAYQKSENTGKPIMANFTGSDWCIWCKRLSSAVFVKDKFKEWAEENVVLLELDFPKRKQLPQEIKKQNANLQRAFSVRGFPTVWVFTANKNEETGKYELNAMGKTGYTSSVDQFTNTIDKIISNNSSEGTQ